MATPPRRHPQRCPCRGVARPHLDLTRLRRNQGDLSKLLERLSFRGVRVIGVQDGYDSSRRGHRLQAGAAGIVGEAFRKVISDRTFAAPESRALRGEPTGGKAYGYVPATESTTSQIEIHAEQAEIVRRICTLHAQGTSARAIADLVSGGSTDGARASSVRRCGHRVTDLGGA
jgi:DNA invertase Pin-like site-specific DNA recombinase